MNPPLYFIHEDLLQGARPDPQADDPFARCRGKLTELGFGPILTGLRGNGTLFHLDGSGPAGNGGSVLAVWPRGESLDLVGYFPERQTWQQVREQIWVGWNGPGPVKPEALDNGNPWGIDGIITRLADGQEWVVPEIRRPTGHSLPTDCYRDVHGKLVTPLKPAFKELWDESGFFFDLFWSVFVEGQTDQKLPLERGLAFLGKVLALRYRFCDYTQDALRVIDGANLEQLIGITIGWPAMMQRCQELMEDQLEVTEKKSQ